MHRQWLVRRMDNDVGGRKSDENFSEKNRAFHTPPLPIPFCVRVQVAPRPHHRTARRARAPLSSPPLRPPPCAAPPRFS